MTACRNKASRAVTAALVGVLSVGAVPMVAIAATTDGAGLMASDEAAVAKADVEYKGGEPAAEYTYTGRGLGPVPVKVTPVNEDTERVEGILPAWENGNPDREDGAFFYYYVKVGEGNTFSGDVSYVNDKGANVKLTGTTLKASDGSFYKPATAGTYAVVVGQWSKAEGKLNYVGTADTFKIVGQALDDAVLCDREDATDTTFNYDGVNGSTVVSEVEKRINVALDGRVLEKDKDYKLQLWEVGASSAKPDDELVAIGTKYIIKIEGAAGSAYEGQKIEREFTLGKLNLDDAVVLGKVFTKADGHSAPVGTSPMRDIVVSINGEDNLNWDGLNDKGDGDDVIALTFVSDPAGNQTSGSGLGAYTYTLAASEDNPNVEGSATVVATYASYEAEVNYDGELKPNDDGDYVVDLNAEDPVTFDLADIDVDYYFSSDTTHANPQRVPSEGYSIKVTDDEGNVVDDMSAPGTYRVRVDVSYEFSNDSGNDFLVAGSEVFTVVVKYNVDPDSVFFSYKDKNVAVGTSDEYDGTDLSQHFSFKVLAGSKTLAEGTDYEVVLQKVQDDGKVVDVDSIVDAGYYNVVVRGITFSDDYVFDFEVTPIELGDGDVRIAHTYVEDGVPALAYTGDVIDASFERLVDDKGNDDPDDDVWEALPADLYEVEYTADEDGDDIAETVELKELGEYTAYLTTAEGVTNYDIDAEEDFLVTDTKVFGDVSNDQWYSESVYEAARLGYMTGYAGTKLFGPADSISRADVVVTLYKMAGLYEWEEGAITPDYGYDLPYTDVDEFEYYAKALQWATKLGIVSGDGATGGQTFRPTDTVTREELAKMLYRFMELQGKTGEVDTDAVLGAYEDESSVSDWARTYVAWLVEQGVMGQNSGLEGNKAISRAEVAAMAVRLQPNGQLNGDEFLDPTPQPGMGQ